jgi:uncharacterized phiE125 gp8 family phage protein
MAAQGVALPVVTMSEAQAYVRIETGEEEALLAGLIRTASALCEAFLGQAVIARSFATDVPASCKWQRIEPAPVQSISSLEAVDVNGVLAAVPSANYAVDIDAGGDGWVRVIDSAGATRVRVSGTAGQVRDQPEHALP